MSSQSTPIEGQIVASPATQRTQGAALNGVGYSPVTARFPNMNNFTMYMHDLPGVLHYGST